ncbi:LysR family transcriptional regulator [Citrobacter youngae]|uniref:LysR family transcriptional regulator n=1 Tax=Citrobacter youngae TaxID=133448 RepID=UPI001EE4E1E9|nr:LysR family transcriptional regulator [Citrobacter youngae]
MNRVSIEELTAFVAVAETGSFRGAAERIGRDATVLSRRIGALESFLGVQLFSRTTRRVTLTEVGVMYHRRVRMLLDELDIATREASNFAASARGQLRVSLPVAFGRLWIAPFIPTFINKYPEIRIDARYIDRFVDVVAEGFDVAIRVGALKDSSLRARRIGSFQNLLVASPGYIARHGTPSHPKELIEHQCLTFARFATSSDWTLKKGKQIETLRPEGPLIADNSETLLLAAIHDTGMAMLPDWLVSPALQSGKLINVLPDWRGSEEGEVFAVMPPGPLLPTKTRVFVDEIISAFADGWKQLHC